MLNKKKNKGISIDIKQGEFLMIQGNSGGGKTTLLNIMGTIDKPTKVYIIIYKSKRAKEQKK
jgi:putative ABC transport system ATP-binding protein